MCDIWGALKNHPLIVMSIGSSIFLFSSFFPVFSSIILLIVWLIGIFLFLLGSFCYIANQNTPKKQWKNIFRFVIIIGVLLGFPIMLYKIDPKDIQSILTLYIGLEIAIPSISMAALTLNSKLVQSLKTNKMVDVERFKGFFVISLFTLILSIIYNLITYFPMDNPLTTTIFGITLYSFNTLLWVITFFILLLVTNLMFYMAMILEEIWPTQPRKQLRPRRGMMRKVRDEE